VNSNARSLLYFHHIVAQFGRRMTRRFFRLLVLGLTGLLATRFSSRADATNLALAKAEMVQSNVVYLRVSRVAASLPGEMDAANRALTATNAVAGTVLDLRFANGDDSAAAVAAAKLFAARKLPLAILVNDQTHGPATALALALREERAGLIFGSATAEVKPDIIVAVKPDDEMKFFENPYTAPATNKITALPGTNDFLPFVDHTSEALLVHDRRKDGADVEGSALTTRAEPPRPIIRDPALARAVDLIEGLAVVRARHK
jgi:hypothetical protein